MKFIFSFFVLFFSINIFANNVIDINKKIEEAKKEKKDLMIFFHIPDCPYCKRMLDENFKDDTIIKLIDKSFILIDIYTADKRDIIFKEFKGSPKEFAKHTKATAYPATLFIDTDSKVFYKAIGYRNTQEYVYELKYVINNSYKEMPLDEFIVKMEIEDEL